MGVNQVYCLVKGLKTPQRLTFMKDVVGKSYLQFDEVVSSGVPLLSGSTKMSVASQTSAKRLGMAIYKSLSEGTLELRFIGKSACNQAMKAIAVASVHVPVTFSVSCLTSSVDGMEVEQFVVSLWSYNHVTET